MVPSKPVSSQFSSMLGTIQETCKQSDHLLTENVDMQNQAAQTLKKAEFEKIHEQVEKQTFKRH